MLIKYPSIPPPPPPPPTHPPPPPPPPPPPKSAFNFKKADWTSFRERLDEAIRNWDTRTDLTATQLDARFTETVLQAAKRSIPYGRGNRKQCHAFWNPRCQEAVDERDEALAAAIADNHSREDVQKYQFLRGKADYVMAEERTSYVRGKIVEMGRIQPVITLAHLFCSASILALWAFDACVKYTAAP